MSIKSYKTEEIVIAGAGIAAAAAALRLLSCGFRVRILSLDRRPTEGMEAIPEAAFPMLRELDLESAAATGGQLVEGFENEWMPGAPILRPGRWLHVERAAFADQAMRKAVEAGAKLAKLKSLPPLVSLQESCFAAIDATGRSAVWSRPIRRRGNQIADLFQVARPAPRGRIVRLPDGWAYQIGATLGIVNSPRRRPNPRGATRYIGRRPAFPQWSENPIEQRRIAIGDAALAYDPVAGQGIRFALASAFAAASVIQTWSIAPDAEAATRFYRDFVVHARIRHLDFLRSLDLERPAEKGPFPAAVFFSARTGTAELSVDSRIVTGQAILLEDRTAVRWVGGVDLLEVEQLARSPVSCHGLIDRLAARGLDRQRVSAVVGWCLRKNILQSDISKNAPELQENANDLK